MTIEQIADAMEEHFKQTIATLVGKPFEQTGVNVPNRSVWLGYANAVKDAELSLPGDHP